MFKLRIYQPPVRIIRLWATERRVLETFKEYPEGLTDEELASLLGIKENSARWTRYKLEQRGLLQALPASRTIDHKKPRKLFALTKKSKRFPTGA